MKARNFLVFQGDVESVASKSPQVFVNYYNVCTVCMYVMYVCMLCMYVCNNSRFLHVRYVL